MIDLLNLTDNELINLIQKKNEQAFEVLLARYTRLIYKVVHKYAYDFHDKEDFFQEGAHAFYKAILNYGSVEKQKTLFYTYALSCIRNHLIVLFNQKHSILKGETAYEVNTEEAFFVAERQMSDQAIEAMREDDEDTLKKRKMIEQIIQTGILSEFELYCLRNYLSGKKIKDTAAELNLDAKTVNNALTRVRRKIREASEAIEASGGHDEKAN